MAENELPEPESVKLFEGMTGGDGGAIPTYDVTIRVQDSARLGLTLTFDNPRDPTARLTTQGR